MIKLEWGNRADGDLWLLFVGRGQKANNGRKHLPPDSSKTNGQNGRRRKIDSGPEKWTFVEGREENRIR